MLESEPPTTTVEVATSGELVEVFEVLVLVLDDVSVVDAGVEVGACPRNDKGGSVSVKVTCVGKVAPLNPIASENTQSATLLASKVHDWYCTTVSTIEPELKVAVWVGSTSSVDPLTKVTAGSVTI